MSDLIARLRAYGQQLDDSVAIARHTVVHHGAELQREAADRLERMEKSLRYWVGTFHKGGCLCSHCENGRAALAGSLKGVPRKGVEE